MKVTSKELKEAFEEYGDIVKDYVEWRIEQEYLRKLCAK